MEMKYIIVKTYDHECPIIFDPLLEHLEVSMCLGENRVVSAGMVDFAIKDGKASFCCYGYSHTLQKGTRQEDSDIIQKRFGE